MSDTRTEGQEEEIVVATRPSVGERLREAREGRGMSAADVAASLKLSARQIEALEAGNWGALPGNAFIRGFVRNYARVVQLDAEALLVDLDVPAPQPPRLDPPQNATAVMPAVGQPQKKDYAAVLAGFVLVAIAVVAYFVVPPDFWAPKSRVPQESANVSPPVPVMPPADAAAGEGGTPPGNAAAASPDRDATLAAVQPAASVPPGEVASQAVAPVAVAAAPAPAPSAEARGTAGALRFRFTEPSWVEVRDRSGQIVFSQLNAAGSEQAVEGRPPFALVVGNATHVTVTYKGKTIDLQPRSKDDVARVSVE